MAIQEANSVKFSTAILFALGLLLPLWPITLPLFWWLAYRSYKKGGPERISLYELQKAKELFDSGAITEEQFERLKKRTTGIETL